MAWGDDPNNEEGSLAGEEEELAKELQATEDHTILLIDARPSMLRATDNDDGGEESAGRCPLAVALEAAQAVLRRIILQGGGGQRNKVGIMLFGAEQEEQTAAEDEEEEEGEGEGKEAGAAGGFGGGGFGSAVGGQHFFLQPLAPPNATRIGQLGRLCKPGADLAAELRLRWPEQSTAGGGGGGAALHKALRTCLRTLESGSRKVDRDAKRIWLFTNEDDPGSAGPEAAEPTRQGIKDALDSRAEVRLYFFPVSVGEGEGEEGAGKRRGGAGGGGFRDFDVGRFYEPLLAKQALGHAEWEGDGGEGGEVGEEWDDEDEAGPDDAKLVDATAGGVARLKEEVGKRAFRKRRYARMGLHLAPAELLEGASAASASASAEDGGANGSGRGGLTLAVALYKTVQPAKKPAPVQLAAASNRRLVASTRHLSEALVKYVDLELEARHSLDFAGAALEWGKAQFDAVKRAGRGPPGIHLLGFVPAADLAWELSVGGPTLLYPEESLLKGCTRAFIALREAMLRRGVMALARFHATARAEPRMAALLAHPESPGLEMVKLPFLDDVRSVVLPPGASGGAPRPSPGTVMAAARVVRSVLPREEFAPEGFPNPALRKFFTVLEALALEEEGREWDEQAEDDTFVQWEENDNARRKLEQVAPTLAAWAEACQDDCGGFEEPAPAKGKGKGKGKAAAAGGGGGGGKKRKAKDEDVDEDGGSVGSGGGKKKAKKPAAAAAGGKKKKARAAASDDEEEDEWGDKAGGEGGGGEGEEVDAMEVVRGLIESGGISKLKVDELKDRCRALGVGVTGKKADLIDRLKQVVEEF